MYYHPYLKKKKKEKQGIRNALHKIKDKDTFAQGQKLS